LSELTGLYLHIPFCRARCHYCDFATWTGREGEIARYLSALATELAGLARSHPGRRLATLFVGGGTPTLLSPDQWRGLARVVHELFPFAPDHEATVECNPESATDDRLTAFRGTGVNRLSFGLQTTQPALLRALNRVHTVETFGEAFRRARVLGFDNINIDLMYGLPGQSREDWRATLSRVVDWGPEHVSAYALSVEEDTVLHRRGVAPDDDRQADMYEDAADVLTAAGYEHYEISNFARPGRAARHNLRYWLNQECLGAGVSAAWYADGRRRHNTDDLENYLSAVEAGRSPVTETVSLSPGERAGEDLMLGLRLSGGVAPTAAQREGYGGALRRHAADGLLRSTRTDGVERWVPTRRGWRLSNRMFQDFLVPESGVGSVPPPRGERPEPGRSDGPGGVR
jgi:oxygen-independent coproporphyrinogen-3 oxidase